MEAKRGGADAVAARSPFGGREDGSTPSAMEGLLGKRMLGVSPSGKESLCRGRAVTFSAGYVGWELARRGKPAGTRARPAILGSALRVRLAAFAFPALAPASRFQSSPDDHNTYTIQAISTPEPGSSHLTVRLHFIISGSSNPPAGLTTASPHRIAPCDAYRPHRLSIRKATPRTPTPLTCVLRKLTLI
jgi:hypothetical protein